MTLGGSAAGAGTLVFDGFTRGGFIAFGTDVTIDQTADINGETVNGTFVAGTTFSNQNFESSVFAPTNSVIFDNFIDTEGGAQARVMDLQFTYTPVPEPSSFALLGLGSLALLRRRR